MTGHDPIADLEACTHALAEGHDPAEVAVRLRGIVERLRALMPSATTVKVGDVVAWADVPDGAMVRGVAKHGREAFYCRKDGCGWWVGGMRPLMGGREFIDALPPLGASWPQWSCWPGAPSRVTIIALGITELLTGYALQRFAEDFEKAHPAP